MNTTADNSVIKPPENALFRSHIEIVRILEELAKDSVLITAETSGGRTFASQILFVDKQNGLVYISYSANKALNQMVLDLTSIKFTASQHRAHIEFELFNPAEFLLDGNPAIRFKMPNALVIGDRRLSPRTLIPAEASLRCIADAGGFISFESHIIDISHEGLGVMIYGGDINIDSGTVLKGCRVIIPGGQAVIVDLEIKNISIITQPDGTNAHRVGLRFVNRPDELTELIGFFIRDLGKV